MNKKKYQQSKKKWEGMQEKASTLLNSSQKLSPILKKIRKKIEATTDFRINTLKSDMKTGLEMIKAYLRRDYRKVPWKVIVALLAGLLYFLNPIDVIPDFIPFQGLVDDFSVLAFVFKLVREELEKFKNWQREDAVETSSSSESQ